MPFALRWRKPHLQPTVALLLLTGLTLRPGPLRISFLAKWAPELRAEQLQKLRRAHRQGLFQCEDRVNSGKELGEEELLWSREYASGGAYQFWSLGQPKVEIENLCSELKQLEEFEGFSAVILACGLGLDVAHLASAAAVNAVNGSAVVVGGVDFAWKAIEVARSQHGAAGCFFYHADVCELPAPSVPLDMVIDNTVFQNVFRSGRLEEYLETLTRISTEGHTLLHLNLMSREGVEQRPQFREAMEQLNLPLLTRDEILGALGDQWQVTDCREGHYDLKPEGAGLQCDAFYSLDSPTPGIPSWCIKALRQKKMGSHWEVASPIRRNLWN